MCSWLKTQSMSMMGIANIAAPTCTLKLQLFDFQLFEITAHCVSFLEQITCALCASHNFSNLNYTCKNVIGIECRCRVSALSIGVEHRCGASVSSVGIECRHRVSVSSIGIEHVELCDLMGCNSHDARCNLMDGWPRLALLTLATTGLLCHIWSFTTHRGYLHHMHGHS